MTRVPDWEEVVAPDGQHYLLLARRIGVRRWEYWPWPWTFFLDLIVFTLRWMMHVTVARLKWRITISRIPKDADLRSLTDRPEFVRGDWRLSAMSKAETLEALDRYSDDIMCGRWPGR